MYKSVFTLVLMLQLLTSVLGQDKIYYKKNKVDNWRVTELNPQYIKAVDAADSGLAYSTTLTNVLFVFNRLGNFLVIPGMYDGKKNAETISKNFFNEERSAFNDFDKLITFGNEIIICTIKSMEAGEIVYTANKKDFSIPKSKVALAVLKNGEHRLFTSADKAFKALSAVQEKYVELAMGDYEVPDTSKDNSLADKDTVTINDKGPHTGTAKTVKTEHKLPQATIVKLQDKALANIKQLGDYIQIICQKDTDPDEVTKTIEQALALFIGDSKIEVSSINRSTVNQFAIKDYLIKLGMLKYEKVIIEWYNIQYTSLLRKGPDGFYYGTIEFEQRFVGISADNQKYEDITRKTVEVVLKTYERNTGGETTMEWDVFLGDIGVTVTKPA
ncbi:MAG TPA: hypothetical protein VKA49_17610 [Flavitalea sp.]|nr:hypothetical protein [Flavitalea sp.]